MNSKGMDIAFNTIAVAVIVIIVIIAVIFILGRQLGNFNQSVSCDAKEGYKCKGSNTECITAKGIVIPTLQCPDGKVCCRTG